MGFWSKLFDKEEKTHPNIVKVDMHSHILPNLDDGSESLENSLELVENMVQLGYEKLIMTPHIMGDFYKNTPESIREKLSILQKGVDDKGWNIQLDIAAEYYIDESFSKKIEKNDFLLTLGDTPYNYVLVETSYMNKPSNLYEIIFEMKTLGYQPVLAHPERYTYLYESFDKFKEIYERGVSFQINLNSLTGHYSGTAKKYVEQLIDNEMVDFIGSDCHGIKHIHTLKKAMSTKHYAKLEKLNLFNNSLL